MKLRFLFLPILLMALVVRGAVPSYNNVSIAIQPTNLLRSNILNSATLTWSVDSLGRMTPNVIGGASSNAQPPSANLTNWSTVTTQALRVARTVFVRTNGNDATGAREWIHLPFANISWAKTNAQPGDTIDVGPGTYTNHNLLKGGVNYYFHTGATIDYDAPFTGPGYGIFDDRASGPTTNVITGDGVFLVDATEDFASINPNFFGTIAITEATTKLIVKGHTVGLSADSISGARGAIYVVQGSLTLDLDEIIDQADSGLGTSDASGIIWAGLGEVTADVQRNVTRGRGIYIQDGGASAVSSFRYTGQIIDAHLGVSHTASSTNQMVQINVSEINSEDGGLHFEGGGRSFVTAQRITRYGPSVGGAVEIIAGGVGAYLHVTAHELVASNSFAIWMSATATNAFMYVRANNIRDLGTMEAGVNVGAGTLVLDGMRIKPNFGPAIRHDGGTARLVNCQLMASSTNAPVFVTGSGLELIDCVLSGGTHTNSIYVTNAQTVTVLGTLSATTNDHPSVTVTSGDLVRRSSDGYWVSPSTTASVTGPYILFTNGSGTNTSFFGWTHFDGPTTNASPARFEDDGWFFTDLRIDGNTTMGGTLNVTASASVAGTMSTTNLIVTNRVIQAIQTTAFNGTNITIDLRLGNVFALPTITNNVKLWPTNGPGAGFSQQAIIYADMDGTGGYTLYANSVVSETNYTSLVWSNAANAKNTIWMTTDKTGTNFQFLVNPDFRK